MKSKYSTPLFCAEPLIGALLIALTLQLSGCASKPPEESLVQSEVPEPAPVSAPLPMSPLSYYQLLSRMTPAELGRERMVLAALPRTPNTQLRQAMLFGYPRAPQDIARAMAQLDSVLKSTDPAAIDLQPLARLLADSYAERLKMEVHVDRQGQQLKESQRKVVELQEKIDGLADIERTLPQRPRAGRPPAVSGGAK